MALTLKIWKEKQNTYLEIKLQMLNRITLTAKERSLNLQSCRGSSELDTSGHSKNG